MDSAGEPDSLYSPAVASIADRWLIGVPPSFGKPASKNELSMQSSPDPTVVEKPDRWVGSLFGKYRIVGKLGEGGMGVVYEAEDESLKRHVALKIVAAREPREVKRFVAEAQAAARLNHPNVVTVYEVSQFDGQHFLAMELVRGMSASEYLRTRGPMEWKVATRVLVAACRGLAAAHQAGLIHRDLKPGNILLAKKGEIKIADFGLAKWLGETERSMTAKGTVLGTPEYMSPEQCSSDLVTPQSDLYSLGASYFALLTGRPPFVCEQPVQTMFAHCSQPPPDPREFVPEIPAACAEIVRRAMAKQPHERFASATEMQTALETALKPGSRGESLAAEQTASLQPMSAAARVGRAAEHPTQPMTLSRRSQVRGILLGAVLTVTAIVIAVVAIPYLNPPQPADNSDRAQPDVRANDDLATKTSKSNTVAAPSSGLLSKATRAGHVVTLSESANPALVGVAISPNGRFLGVRLLGRSAGRLLLWDLNADEPLLDRREPEYSLRGRPLVMDQFLGSRMLQFTRTSDWLVVGELSGLDFDLEAWPVPTKAGDLRKTLDCGSEVRSLTVSPTRDQLAVSLAVPTATDDASLKVYDGWPQSAASPNWSQRTHAVTAGHLHYDSDGEHLIVSNGMANARRISVSRPGMRLLIPTTLNFQSLCYSPLRESSWLAVGGANVAEVWDAAHQTRQTEIAIGGAPATRLSAMTFAPDGRTLFVAAVDRGTTKLLAYETENWTLKETIGTNPGLVSSMAVSPTRPVLVTGDLEGTLRLWDVSPR